MKEANRKEVLETLNRGADVMSRCPSLEVREAMGDSLILLIDYLVNEEQATLLRALDLMENAQRVSAAYIANTNNTPK